MNLEFDGEVWYWRGPAPWYFVTVPAHLCDSLEAVSGAVSYGWGMIPATIQVGQTRWKTSLFPKNGSYVVPIKTVVRNAENIQEGDVVALRIEVDQSL